jgi:hypothetical protein
MSDRGVVWLVDYCAVSRHCYVWQASLTFRKMLKPGSLSLLVFSLSLGHMMYVLGQFIFSCLVIWGGGECKRLFCSPKRPEELWGPSNPLFSGYRGCFPRIKRPEIEINRPPPSCGTVKNEWSYTSAPPTCFRDVDRDEFTFRCVCYINPYELDISWMVTKWGCGRKLSCPACTSRPFCRDTGKQPYRTYNSQ